MGSVGVETAWKALETKMAPSGAGTGSPRGTPGPVHGNLGGARFQTAPRAEAHADRPPPHLGCSRSAAGKAEEPGHRMSLAWGRICHSGTPVLEGHSSCFMKAASLRTRTSVRQKTSPRERNAGPGRRPVTCSKRRLVPRICEGPYNGQDPGRALTAGVPLRGTASEQADVGAADKPW